MKKILIVFLALFSLSTSPVKADPWYTDPPKSTLSPFSSFANKYNDQIFGEESGLRETNGFVGALLTRLVPILLTVGGLILLIQLIAGGFAIMTAVDDPKKADAGKQQITQALIGFLLLFAAFWIAQALEIIFGIKFLGTTTTP